MSDFYTEQLIKKRKTGKDLVIQILLVMAVIVSCLVIFIFPLGIILPVGVAVLAIFLNNRLDVEYEYLYVNGDLDIDKIMHKAKRKRVCSVNIADMELLAPADAGELRQFQRAKVYDFTSCTGNDNVYALIIVGKGEQKKILFEPNDQIVEGFFMMAPRKVVRKK
ncbi:DUF6106 family protein [Lachnospiraceae bacterium 50-23]|jgi:hypothetical protein|nr:hypothetical protein [Dorea sp.]GFI37571.1 hypothetical protein IMSAGC015_01758 [Lachnospiraceae bacterium]